MVFRLRPYQARLAREGLAILREHGLVYLALEMRVGKTHVAMEIASRMRAKRVLFVTKILAMGSVEDDYRAGGYEFRLDVINYESAHKLEGPWDLVIVDEAHSIAAFPKPNKRARKLKAMVGGTPVVYLSGTPTPESYSQMYHQLWVSDRSPFREWATFYDWVRAGFVAPVLKRVSGFTITDYSRADRARVEAAVKPLTLTLTQKQAKFRGTEVTDTIVVVPVPDDLTALVEVLCEERYYRTRGGLEIVCDTAVKLQSKIQQVCSGTVIAETGEGIVLDESKARYIKGHYRGKRLAIFYLFIAEGKVLEKHFPGWTRSPEEFRDEPGRVFISQFQSGARGIDLSAADVIIFYNIMFSSETYQQARQRGQAKDKAKRTEVHWLFSEGGIESNIYKRVVHKLDYTLSWFMRDYGV